MANYTVKLSHTLPHQYLMLRESDYLQCMDSLNLLHGLFPDCKIITFGDVVH